MGPSALSAGCHIVLIFLGFGFSVSGLGFRVCSWQRQIAYGWATGKENLGCAPLTLLAVAGAFLTPVADEFSIELVDLNSSQISTAGTKAASSTQNAGPTPAPNLYKFANLNLLKCLCLKLKP